MDFSVLDERFDSGFIFVRGYPGVKLVMVLAVVLFAPLSIYDDRFFGLRSGRGRFQFGLELVRGMVVLFGVIYSDLYFISALWPNKKTGLEPVLLLC